MLGENRRTSNVRINVFSVFVIMRRIHSQHFQICGIDKYWGEYWQITYVKVSSPDNLTIYVRTPENADYSGVKNINSFFDIFKISIRIEKVLEVIFIW